ncbi:protein kinase domain-containing protein [Leminorella grimontii]|uniref:protein kinase domain-containing protein n=1 Tax=Leminorella grimontii TaxID=82981 RepID=UPI00321FD95C
MMRLGHENHSEPSFFADVGEPLSGTCASEINGWRITDRLPKPDEQRDRYRVVHEVDGRRGVLILYAYGCEPDPAVYDVVHRLPKEHVSELLDSGRWRDRAWYVMEALDGGSLLDAISQGDFWQPNEVRDIVRELGSALANFSENGLRHRDLRPANLLIRTRHPLDIVIIEFGSACLSERDVDVVSPLEMSRYSAPETLAGGVSSASDWWSLGMILLEQLTQRTCFDDRPLQAFLIETLTSGVTLPDGLDDDIYPLLGGLLTVDRRRRWQWSEVAAWLDGRPIEVIEEGYRGDKPSGLPLFLGDVPYSDPAAFALAAAQADLWPQALAMMQSGAIVRWAQSIGLPPSTMNLLYQVMELHPLSDDFRLLLTLKLLSPPMPLIYRGEIVTPSWLAKNPTLGYELISGPLPTFLADVEQGHWLALLKAREERVREKGMRLEIAMDEERLRLHLLATSRARLLALWERQRRLFPETHHEGLALFIDRRTLSEEELIVLLSADIAQFVAAEGILVQAAALAREYGVTDFDKEEAREWIGLPRQALYQELNERISGFNRCAIDELDRWADGFVLERRLPLERALVMLAIEPQAWKMPERQRYVNQVLNFFSRKIRASSMRGSLVRMSVTPHSARIDLTELDGKPSAQRLLNHVLARHRSAIGIDSTALTAQGNAGGRLRTLTSQTQMYQRDTGIDSLYLGFPFILTNLQPGQIKPRIAPLLLWPVSVSMAAGVSGAASLRFDADRGVARLNPALENVVNAASVKQWQAIVDELMSRRTLTIDEVMQALGIMANADGAELVRLPPLDVVVPERETRLACSAVLFQASFLSQAIGEDLYQLCQRSPVGTALETALGMGEPSPDVQELVGEASRFFVSATDPSQEAAVMAARRAPGLLIEGPPGTGKSQTIVNMVADAIGQQRSLLVVCQKATALDVVYKRITASGLSDRVVIVRDALSGRETIRSVREQLDNYYRSLKPAPLFPWRSGRQKLAAQIDRLERELDDYYQALYQPDPAVGISYRALMGELIRLEGVTMRLEAPELHEVMKSWGLSELTNHKLEILPEIALWLAADYEDSPLARLSPFISSASAIAAFSDAFDGFRSQERERDVALSDPHRDFDSDDVAGRQSWLESTAHGFLTLSPEQWDTMARWLPLFYVPIGAAGPGEPILTQLGVLIGRLQAIDVDGSDPLLFEPLSRCEDSALIQLAKAAAQQAQGHSALRYFNPFYYFNLRRLKAFMVEMGLPFSLGMCERVLASVRQEQQWRRVRAELTRLGEPLGVEPVGPLDGLGLSRVLADLYCRLELVEQRYRQLAESPDAARLVSAIVARQQDGFIEQCDEIRAAVNRSQARAQSLKALDTLQNWLTADALSDFTCAIKDNRSLRETLDLLTSALPTLDAYQRFRPVAAQMNEPALAVLRILRHQAPALKALDEAELMQTVENTLDREARRVWKQLIEWRFPILQQPVSHREKAIAHMAKASAMMRERNMTELTENVTEVPIRPSREWEEITRLSGKRMRRLREFIEEGVELGLMTLRPVWLMTPDVASQVLPLTPGMFDTVIYDEASQMPVEYALPTLYRSKKMVVSGDEKQMPPSAFFSGRLPEDDDGAEAEEAQQELAGEVWDYRKIGDCPDLLHLARTVLPVQTLEIHYRSAYRELINFSNHAFYHNRLNIPVQHSGRVIDAVKPVRLIDVGGLYQNQSNLDEAKAAVETLADVWARPFAERPSVGVVTFNQKQAQLIQNELEERASRDDAFRQAYREELARLEDGEDMSFFVKNVENVQGDERDMIVFSTTFGRNAQGAFRRNFGVLGQQGGERRLNVAVTRAKKQVTVLSSMPIDEISDLLTTRRRPDIPRDFLQGYLEYVRILSAGEFERGGAFLRRMSQSGGASADREMQDGLVQSVRAFIRDCGWTVADARREGAFYFDALVEDADSGRYAIGIECDMPHHPLLERARARELWRPSVVARTVPHRYRISLWAWYHDAHEERRRLSQAIEQALTSLRMPPERESTIRDMEKSNGEVG